MDAKEIATAIENSLISPNESDRNLEPANVVDALFAIARAVNGLAKAQQEYNLLYATQHDLREVIDR